MRNMIRMFVAGLCCVRKLYEASHLGIQGRHQGAKHDTEMDVIVEPRISRNSDWKTVHLRIHKHGDDQDELTVNFLAAC